MNIQNIIVVVVCLVVTACGTDPQLPRLADSAVILAFGDSLTYGTGADKTESYPVILEQLAGRKVVNAGVPGEISQKGLQRLPGQIALHEPDLLILCHGGNDFLRKHDLKQAENNVHNMVQLAQRQNIPVILLGVPRPGLFLSSADMYEEIADATGALLINDLIPDILGKASLKSDTVHPNKDGYRKIAEHIYSVLKQNGAI